MGRQTGSRSRRRSTTHMTKPRRACWPESPSWSRRADRSRRQRRRSMPNRITGTGMYLPEKVLTNDDLSKIIDTTDEWIVARTGIRRRHIAADNQSTSDLALEASLAAIADAGLKPADVGLIIVATTTPDMIFPSTACH